jgi:predicted nucleic acid-binding protein
MKIYIFPLLIPGGEYVNKTPLNRRNMANLLCKKSVEKKDEEPFEDVDPAVNEEFQEDLNMEDLDTDDTLTIGEIAAAKAAKIAAAKAAKIIAEKAEDEEEPLEDIDGGVVGPGSGVAGAALSPRDWHQEEEEFLEDFNMEALNTDDTLIIGEIAAAKAAKIAEKAVEVTYSQTMSVKCQKQQEPQGLVVSPQEPQVSNTNGFTFNNCNNITFVMKK